MTQLAFDQIPTQLPTLIQQLGPGDEIVIVDGDKPLARVTPAKAADEPFRRKLGTAKGVLRIIAEDDEHLCDFAEYM